MLGICLGMQLLATRSTEFGEHEGLDLIPGSVERIETDPDAADPARRLERPRASGADDPLLGALGPEPTFYYVHTYEFLPDDPAAVTGVTDYGGR